MLNFSCIKDTAFRLNAKRKDGCVLFSLKTEIRKITKIPVEKISPSPWQARRNFDERELSALAVSIKENGLLQPISVYKEGEQYILIAGERRLRATKLCGLKEIPAIIQRLEEKPSAILALEENLQRSGLKPFEEAEAMRALLSLWNCTQVQGAARLGISQSTLANKLRILGVSDDVRIECEEKQLTERHIRAILRLPDDKTKIKAVKRIYEKNMTVASTEKMVDTILKPIKSAKKIKPMVRDVRIFINTIDKAIETMKSSGVMACCTRIDKEEYIEYTVKIPTKNSEKKLRVENI